MRSVVLHLYLFLICMCMVNMSMNMRRRHTKKKIGMSLLGMSAKETFEEGMQKRPQGLEPR